MGMWVMVPSDTYHNFIQTHIAFTLYFPLPFWLLTASSRLKFYLNGSIWLGERTLLSAICLIVYITAGRVLLTWGQAPASRVWKISRAKQQPLQRCDSLAEQQKVKVEEDLNGTCHPESRLSLRHLVEWRKENKCPQLPDKRIITVPPPKRPLHR